MKQRLIGFIIMSILSNCMLFGLLLGQDSVNVLIDKISQYEFGDSRLALTAMEDIIVNTQNPGEKKDLAQRLAQILESDATLAAKQFVCQQLRFIGAEEQVPILAKMLLEGNLADEARFALEMIPSPKADEAMRNVLHKIEGKQRIGVINSLGQRRDVESSEVLGNLLADRDREAAAAAAVALGMIGTREAAEQLKKEHKNTSGKWREMIAKSYLACADEMRKTGAIEQSIKIYSELYQSSETQYIQIQAFAGLIYTEQRDVSTFVLEALKSNDSHFRKKAMEFVRDWPGQFFTQSLSYLLSDLSSQNQIILIKSLGDRGDPSALPDILELISNNNEQVRIEAIRCVGYLGDSRHITLLLKQAATAEGLEKEVAQESLYRLRGDDVNDKMLELLAEKDTAQQLELIRAFGARRAKGALFMLFLKLKDNEQQIRIDSWKAIELLAGQGNIENIVDNWIDISNDNELKTAEDAMVIIARRDSCESVATEIIMAALEKEINMDVKSSLLSGLGRMGADTALPLLRKELHNNNTEIKDGAVRALAAWPSNETMPDLKHIAMTSDNEVHKVLALRGYIRQIGLPYKRSVEQTIELYKEALQLASRTDEKKLVLSGLSEIDDFLALAVVTLYIEEKALKEEAAAAAVRICDEIIDDITDTEQKNFIREILNKIVNRIEVESLRSEAEEMMNRLR